MSDLATATLLRGTPLFAGLDDRALGALAARCRRRWFAAAEALFHEGDPGHTLYIVIEGTVSIRRIAPDGELLHIADRGPGEMIGELSLIDGAPRMADAVTTERTHLLMLDREEFLRCVEEHPRIAIRVMECLARRLREAADRLEALRSRDVLGRVALTLLELVQGHGAPAPEGGTRIELRLTQQELAVRAGASRESVNRALAALRRSRVIRLEGRHIVVLDAGKLRRLAER